MAEFTPITTQEAFDTAIEERLTQERENVKKGYEGFMSPADVKKKYEGFMSPADVKKKYEGYLSPDKVAEKDAEIKGYQMAQMRSKVAKEVGIPADMADRLRGDDEEAMKKDAEALAGILKLADPPDPMGDPERNASKGTDAALRDMAQKLKGDA